MVSYMDRTNLSFASLQVRGRSGSSSVNKLV
jgi:hypothetical protein